MSVQTDKRLNLLVVDDSAMMRAMIKRAAGLANVPIGTVYEAANGAEALQMLETNASIDALFTDINMPVMTGIELLAALDGQDRWKDLLRVIISTDGSNARKERAEQLHACQYVEKPFKPEAIRDVLATLL